MKILLLLLALPTFAQEPSLPDAHTRARMVKELAAEMARLDGEALFVRRNRARTFTEIAEELSSQAVQALDWRSLLEVFARLDNAYPNLHAGMTAGEWRGSRKVKLQPKIRFAADWLAPQRVEYRISAAEVGYDAQPGDRLLAINGKSMKEVGDEYFEFCKMPLREQCDAELPAFFEWRSETLKYALERGGRKWEIEVPVVEVPRLAREYRPCEEDKDLYEGFTLAYKGLYACFFEKNDDPSTVLLRIRIFVYDHDRSKAIHSVASEVEAFWPWWKDRAPLTRHLLIDLTGNGGGNAPIPYYEAFFPKPFQEQWVTFRKIPEMLDAVLRESIFWGEPAQESWFQSLIGEGVWDRTAGGDFLPPVPMFCAGYPRDCRDSLFSPRDHGFTGRVSLIVNPSCVSSCDGFVYAFKDEMNARIIGQPQAADSAYSRLKINVLPDGDRGFRLETVPIHHEGSRGALFSQTIAFSRSVTKNGAVVSGIPVPVDEFVPRFHGQDERQWRRSAVKAAIR